MIRRSYVWFALLVFGAALMLTPAAQAQDTTKRLILKDGSYQTVTKWEVTGDRVHYYSAERGDWEDVPNSMVDWDATNQFEKDRVSGKKSPEALALDKELEQERQEDEARSPQVAPGLRLPPEGGVYALDTYLSEPQLLPLDQNAGDVNRDVKRNILRAAINPVSGAKNNIELPGSRSKIQVHAAVPVIYVNLDPTDQDAAASTDSKGKQLPWDRYRIVRVDVKGDKRIVGAIKTTVTGKSSAEEKLVPTSAQQVGEGWVMITPKAPLTPGEYALAEMLGTQGMNSYVWDFGIHPDAPANLSVIRPEQQKRSTGDSASGPAPGLKKREQ